MRFEVNNRQILTIAVPIILGSVAQNFINVTNTIFLSQVGSVEVGASGLGGILYYALVLVGSALATGTQILVARRMGEGNERAVGPIINQGIYLNLALGFAFFLLIRLGAQPLLSSLLHDAAVLQACTEYVEIRAYEIFFGLLFWQFRALYTGVGQTRVIIYASLGLALINVLLDYTLIFGHFGFTALGIRGAAYASICAEGTAVLIFVLYGIYRRYPGRYQLFHFRKVDTGAVGQSLSFSLPLILQNLLSMGAWEFFFLQMESLGARQLAAANYVRSLYMVFMLPTWGFGAATNTLVSNLLGQRKASLVLLAVSKVARLSFITSAVLALVVVLVPRLLLRLYVDDLLLIAEAVPSLWVVALALLLFSIAWVYLNAVTGTGATRLAFAFEVFFILCYVSYLVALPTVLQGGMTAIWGAEPLYFLLMLVTCGLYLRYGNWRRVAAHTPLAHTS